MAASNVQVVNAGRVTATAPAGTMEPVDVTVTTPGGTSGVSTADHFTFDNLALLTAGETLSNVTYTPVATLPALPAGATAAVQDVTGFTVGNVAPGGSASVAVQLPAGTLLPGVAYAYFKYDPNNPASSACVRVNPGIATFNVAQQTITLNLQDDGVIADGDEDAANNGDILDPGIPVALAPPTV